MLPTPKQEMAAELPCDKPVADKCVAETMDARVTVMKLSGAVLVTVAPVPNSILELKQAMFHSNNIPVALQKLLESDGIRTYEDTEKLDSMQNHEMLLLTIETPLHTWDVKNNPNAQSLQLEGTSILTCPQLNSDFCTVLTEEPIRSGVHYFEFVMHVIGDEQWCGVTSDPMFSGCRANPRCASNCWTYYCGRRFTAWQSLIDGRGALHAPGHAVAQFKQLNNEGDVIGMLVDMNNGALAFDLNGELQGACPIDTDKPLYCLTQPDTPRDKVELRKPSLQDAPPANLEALSGALLDITKDGKVDLKS